MRPTLSPTASLSLLFKLSSYVYLRVIPSRVALFASLFFFALYLVSLGIDVRANAETSLSRKANPVGSANGDSTDSSASASASAVSHLTSHALWREVLLTHRSSSTLSRVSAILLNLLVVLCSVDFTARPFIEPYDDLVFFRVGAVEPSQANVVLRYPNMTEGVRVLYRVQNIDVNDTSAWSSGSIVQLGESNDWVGIATLKHLQPAHVYEYRLALPNSSFLPHPVQTFRTFPDVRVQHGARFRFIASSCIMPNFPYRPFGGNRIQGFELMADFLEQNKMKEADTVATKLARFDQFPHDPSPLEFVLLLGDFIYADVPFRVGASPHDFTRLYRRNYASPSYRKVYEQLPVLNIYDDHEVSNNFIGQSNDSELYRAAIHPFEMYHSRANHKPVHSGQFYYDFRYGDAAFFVLDTRRHREPGNTDRPTMLGRRQLRSLHSWLGRVNMTSTYKFVVSSVPFTTLWQGDAKIDTWAGFKYERDQILDALASVPNTFILSGDRHEFAAVELSGSSSGRVVELSTSPLSQFYIPLPGWLKMSRSSKRLAQRDGKWIPEERVLKYLPNGNYKWSVIEVDTSDKTNPHLTVETYINGAVRWRHTFSGTPVTYRLTNALGMQITDAFGAILDKMTSWQDPISKYLSG